MLSYDNRFAPRVSRIGTSATLAIAAEAKAMQAQGIDVISLSVGQPDFHTPDHVKAAGRQAIDDNKTGYTPNPGTLDLRNAIADWLKSQHGIAYEGNGEILVSNGAKHSLYNLMMAVVGKGDEVIIPSPYWVSYPEMVEIAGGTPVILETSEDQGFRLTPERLLEAITDKTRILFMNSPSNPTGSAYTREQLAAIAKVVVEKDILVVSDEIYSQLTYDGLEFAAFASLGQDVWDRTITVNGVSKAFSMTGWRIGFAAAPKPIISAMAKVQSHATSNACSIAQEAAAEAFNGSQEIVAEWAKEFAARRDYLYGRISQWAGVSCHRPEGAFYLYPNVRSLYGRCHEGEPIRNSQELAKCLLRKANVAVIPGEAFGTDDYIRLSYATSMAKLEEAANRIERVFGELEPCPDGVDCAVPGGPSARRGWRYL